MNRTRKQKFLQYFNSIATLYPKYRGRFRYYWNDIISYCNYFIHETDSILEIGCGTGETLSKLSGRQKTGIDFCPGMIKKGREQYPDIHFIEAEAENFSLNEEFDVIILSNVIGYFDNLLDVLSNLKKVCNRKTRIIITYYNFLWEPLLKFGELLGIKKKIPQQNWLSVGDIQNILYLSGFESFRTSGRIVFPLNVPVVSFIFNKIIAKLPFMRHLCLNQFVFARYASLPDSENKTQYSSSVVIPARNESGNIENAILRMPAFGKHVEIIFVEGNSTDDTWEKITEMQAKYKKSYDIKIARQDGKGKGDAVRKGYAMAGGDILMILDADLTVPPEDLPKFYDALTTGKGEFINGSRLVYPMEKNAMRPLNTLGNKFFGSVFSWLLEQPVKDSLCGTKVMFRDDYNKLAANRSFFGNFDPFGDFDLLFGAYKLNLKIIDLPVRYKERIYGSTNISRFKHGFLLLRMCFFAAGKIKFR